jgi:hypothetical protein
MTASWLLQIGLCETYILDNNYVSPYKFVKENATDFASQRVIPHLPPYPHRITSYVLSLWLDWGKESVVVLDCGRSVFYSKSHLKGSVWFSRSSLCNGKGDLHLPNASVYVLIESGEEKGRAEMVAYELEEYLSQQPNTQKSFITLLSEPLSLPHNYFESDNCMLFFYFFYYFYYYFFYYFFYFYFFFHFIEILLT